MIVGVDAGGTNVDAAAVDEDGVQDTVKLPAEDASLPVLRDLLKEISDGRHVTRVVVSTTRVLNQVVQSRLPPCTGVLVPGVGLAPEHAYAADENLVYRGCVDHRGRVTEAPVVGEQPTHPVVAVTAKFSPRNPDVEEEVAESVDAEVVSLGNEAGGRLDFPGRAATTAANARSKPTFTEFSSKVSEAVDDVYDASIYYLRGDGAMVSDDTAEAAPAATTRSGPASSSVGLLALSRESDAVCVDVGGTTTDVTLATDGYPVTEEGFSRDGFETYYEGVVSTDLALGGDTRVDHDGLRQRRDDYAAAFGGEQPTLTDALNVAGGGVGDVDASHRAFEDNRLTEEDAEDVVADYVEAVAEAVEDTVNRSNTSVDTAVFGGALAPLLEDRFDDAVDHDVAVPEHADVCAAVGCAVARVSVRTEVHVDTARGRMTVSSVGSRQQSVDEGRVYDEDELRRLVTEETRRETERAGGELGEVEVVSLRSFNVVEGAEVEGQIADAVARVKPGSNPL